MNAFTPQAAFPCARAQEDKTWDNRKLLKLESEAFWGNRNCLKQMVMINLKCYNDVF